jgi:hypothetical protein
MDDLGLYLSEPALTVSLIGELAGPTMLQLELLLRSTPLHSVPLQPRRAHFFLEEMTKQGDGLSTEDCEL